MRRVVAGLAATVTALMLTALTLTAPVMTSAMTASPEMSAAGTRAGDAAATRAGAGAGGTAGTRTSTRTGAGGTAEERAGPRLVNAVVEVAPSASGHRAAVREEITLSGVTRGTTIRGLLAVFTGATVSSPVMTAAGVRMPVTVARAPDAWTLTSVPPPAAIEKAGGTLRMTVAYTVTGSAATPEVPLYVPAYASGRARAVRLVYRVPPGRAVQGDPFPVVIGRTGTQARELRAMPAFLGYRLGPVSAGSGPSVFTWVAVAVLAASVLLTGVAILREGAARRGVGRGETGEEGSGSRV